MDRDHEQRLQARRREGEEFFADSNHSPIPPDRLEEFPGLAYFPVDPDYPGEPAEPTAHDHHH